ncbi:hypothetical protein M1I95_02540 [Rossellomorea marisflavi]|uniref:hypothetical protein n=1 Tax=Rossellomorea marisflavi TaxID=189381 RepID=UPI0027A377DC|nr:hypothetical protein [Rossellomorea marisflavi]UTE73446.1 hypothetical protein M1I95_02540 [Rossellomorea marisflavi]
MKQVILYLFSMIAGMSIGYFIFKPIVEDTFIALLIGFCLGVMTGISVQPLAKKW